MSALVSVNVGLPRDVEWQGKLVHTAIWKQPVTGRVMARRLNLDGDGQGDLAGHGGENRAIMVYQLDSYRHWEQHLQRNDLEYGQFGENFTVDGLADDQVCIGDRYRIGSALFEVTQPRVTCYRVGLRMNDPQMPALLVAHRRPGFYFRVIEEGEIGAGDEIIKVADGPEQLTVADIDALLYLPGHSAELLERALRIPALSQGWKQSFEALLVADDAGKHGGNPGLVAGNAPPPAWQGFRRLRVAGIRQESIDVRSFELAAEDGSSLPAPVPGQFVVVRLAQDEGAAAVTRSYSLSNADGMGTYRISVKRAHGEGSRYMHDRLQSGDMIEVSAPRGDFALLAGTDPVVLISAGIGATPVLAMLHELAADPGNTDREIWWVYGARNGKEHPFAEEVRQLIGGLPHARSIVIYSQPGQGDRQGQDFDMQGHLNLAALQSIHAPSQADFYLCGPPAFMASLHEELKSWGVSDSHIHTEVFGAAPSITPGIASATAPPPHPPAGTPGTGPRVSFTRSGLTVPWGPGYQSILELAEACDVPVRWSCRSGVCHTCECGLVGGALRYTPEPLDQPADGSALICCSMPLSDVELDL